MRQRRGDHRRHEARIPAADRLPIFSITIGSLGLLSEALVNLSPDTAGLFERGGVYSWLLWGLVTGALLLVREVHGTPVAQNVSA